jgi:hypothetical protein
MSPKPRLLGGIFSSLAAGIFGGDDAGQDVVEHPLVVGPDAVLRLLVEGELRLPAPLLPGGLVLVVARPQRQAGMVAQAADVFDRLLADVGNERLVARVHAAGEHEVLPDQQPQLVGEVVEAVVFVDAAAPHAHHVHVRVDR